MDCVDRFVLVPIMIVINTLRFIDEKVFHSRLDVIEELKVRFSNTIKVFLNLCRNQKLSYDRTMYI